MKKLLLIAAMAFVTSSAFAADADFVLVNRTGYAIEEVFISPSKQNAWGKDRLGANRLEHGASRTFRFGDTKNCQQDVKVIFSDDESEVEWADFNLCELQKITLKYNRKSGEVSADME